MGTVRNGISVIANIAEVISSVLHLTLDSEQLLVLVVKSSELLLLFNMDDGRWSFTLRIRLAEYKRVFLSLHWK